MLIKVFSLLFDSQQGMFDEELVEKFCMNKKVIQMRTRFFQDEGKQYLSVVVLYELLQEKEVLPVELDSVQKKLYEKLRDWRKVTADNAGYPVYLVSNNQQMVQIVQHQCMTLESLKLIKGFGKSKIDKYGKDIIELVKNFYEPQSTK